MSIPDPTGGGGADPQALLAQIKDLLDQYLAMGAGTPVDAEAQALSSAIDATMGGGGAPPPGGMPPDAGGMPPPGGMPPDAGGGAPLPVGPPGMPDISGMMPDQMPTSSGGRNPLRGASDMAIEDMKKKSKGR